MFPLISIFGVSIYTFGISLALGFLAFFWMLQRLSRKLSLNPNFFVANAFWIVIGAFFGSRLFYIIGHLEQVFDLSDGVSGGWGWLKLLILSGYDFSLIGGVIGGLIVLGIQTYRYSLPYEKMVDVIVISLLFTSIIGFLGGYLGGQVYGAPTQLPIGVLATHPASPIPFTSPVFPLGLIYMILSGIFFCLTYIIRQGSSIDGLAGCIGTILFSALLIIGEFWSGKSDMLEYYIGINLNQLGAVLFLIIGARLFVRIFRK